MLEAPRPTLLRTEGLGLHIGGVSIVDGVTLDVRAGEFLAIIGPNGAGKTTLFNLISGVTLPTAGRIVFADEDITRVPTYVRARLGLGRTFQTSTVFAGLSTLENARLAAQASYGGSGSIWHLAERPGEPLRRALRALELVGLAHRSAVRAGALSHGEKRKLDLGILLCGEPSLVLLDEPTAGMAIEDVPEMMRLVKRIHQEEGKTVLMVEHRLDVIMGLADRIAVMHHGALLALDTPQRIVSNETVQSAYLGDPL